MFDITRGYIHGMHRQPSYSLEVWTVARSKWRTRCNTKVRISEPEEEDAVVSEPFWREHGDNGYFRNLTWRYLPYFVGISPENMAFYGTNVPPSVRILEISHFSMATTPSGSLGPTGASGMRKRTSGCGAQSTPWNRKANASPSLDR